MDRRALPLIVTLALGVCACGDAGGVAGPTPTPAPAPAPATSPDARTSPAGEPAPTVTALGTPSPARVARPGWLGTRPLPLRADGFGEVADTPAELQDRRLPPPRGPALDPPRGEEFTSRVRPVPDDVAARSTWSPACPVALDDLRYVTVTFWGFDGTPHTGELLVHAGAAEDVLVVFGKLFEARFPIEEMRVVEPGELDAAPTGDGNNTTAFVCRPVRGSTSWSQHAYGLAVDVNPFHNPYLRGDLVLPELASAYVDRTWERPGMIRPGDAVTSAFTAIGWGWGGYWRSPDWMHFSATGR
jgi:hypothetical protein